MDAATIISEIKRHRATLEAAGVRHVFVFGSVARGTAGTASDVDLIFDQDIPGFNLFDYSGLKLLAQDLLPFEVDFIERSCLHPAVRARAEADAIQVF
jgi:predicted nucleotidyltransferase